jgi:diguanylate cyclase (GGDEF)-like protein/PAS domain S-box-containing protein
MRHWTKLITTAKGMPHVIAFAMVFIFGLPVGVYIAHQQLNLSTAGERQAELHSALHATMIEEALDRSVMSTQLLADAMQARSARQLMAIGQNIVKISGTISQVAISQVSEKPVIVIRDHAQVAGSGTDNPLTDAGRRIGPAGLPTLSANTEDLTISQGIEIYESGLPPRFWGYATAVVPLAKLVTISRLRDLAAEGYGVRLQYDGDAQSLRSTLFEGNFDPSANATVRSISLSGLNRLRLEIQSPRPALGELPTVAWLSLAFGCLLLYLLALRLLRRPAELEREVAARTRQLDIEKETIQREVNSRIQAERQLERSHRLLDTIFEHFPGMIILKRAGDLRVSRINRSAETILGRSREAVVGRSPEELYSSDLADRIIRSDYQAMVDNKLVELPLELIELPGQPKRWVRIQKVALPGPTGRSEYILEFCEDITEREALDSRLREHLNFLEQLLDAIPAPIFFKDRDGRYLGANGAFERFLGKSVGELVGRTVFEVSPGELAQTYHRADCDLMAAGGSQIYESRVRAPNGEDRDVMFHKAVFHDTSGGAGGIVGMFLDITERKAAERRISQLNRILSVLSRANQAIVRLKERNALLLEVSKLMTNEGGFPIAWIYLHAENELVILNADETTREASRQVTVRMLSDPQSYASERIYQETPEVYDADIRDELERRGLHTLLHLPLVTDGRHSGGIAMFHEGSGSPGKDEREMLTELAANVSFAIETLAKEEQRKLAESKLQLAARVFENSTEGLIVTDAENRILMVNRTFTNVTGYTQHEVIGCSPAILSSGRQEAAFYAELWRSLAEHGEWRGEIENRRKDGEIYPEWLSISAVKNEHGELTNYVAIFSDLTSRKEIEARINFLAHYDSLTSLPNRVLFTSRLEQLIAQSRAKGGKLAVLFLDLDRFKLFNDSIGHAAGDRLLLEVSARLLDCVPKGSEVSRLGGDEFAIILSQIDSPESIAAFALAIHHALRQTILIDKHEIHISASIGISVFPDDAQSVESLASNADSARYAASAAGGGCFRFFEAEMNSRSGERMRLENGLHHALERGEMAVFFQPLVCAGSGEVIGAEALLRWKHSDTGTFVSPGTFIPLLEETGLIVQVGEWVMHRACEENKRWRETTGRDLFVAVNLSAVQLADDAVVGKISSILRNLDFDAHHLEIELTESAVMRDAQRGIRTLQELKGLGVSLSIDDFGTGYSSLSYLKQLPLDTLKIDRSFVIDAPADTEAVSIIHAILALGHSLQLEIVAEGVEHPAQVKFLRDAGADILQGFYFSKAVSAEDFLQLLINAPRFAIEATQPALQLAPDPQAKKRNGRTRKA